MCEKLPGKPWGWKHANSKPHSEHKTVSLVLSDREEVPRVLGRQSAPPAHLSPTTLGQGKLEKECEQKCKLPAAFQTRHNWLFTWRSLRCSLPSFQEGNGRSPLPGLGHPASLYLPSHHPEWRPQSGEAGQLGPSPAFPEWWLSGGPCRQRGHILFQGDCFPHPGKGELAQPCLRNATLVLLGNKCDSEMTSWDFRIQNKKRKTSSPTFCISICSRNKPSNGRGNLLSEGTMAIVTPKVKFLFLLYYDIIFPLLGNTYPTDTFTQSHVLQCSQQHYS